MALGRVKKEADDMPVTFIHPESRENIRFVFWMIGGAISVIGTIVVAALYVSSFAGRVERLEQTVDKNSERSEQAFVMAKDLYDQRSYGISHHQWYVNRHGFLPNQNLAPQPQPQSLPGPKPNPAQGKDPNNQ